MKPLEAAAELQSACALLMAGHPLPPAMRCWLVGALRKRLGTPGTDLDRLLGLSSRAGGRLHVASKLPTRDRAIRALAGEQGLLADRVTALLDRLHKHRQQPDPELARIERECGRIPRSRAQLYRILGGRTSASQAPESRMNVP